MQKLKVDHQCKRRNEELKKYMLLTVRSTEFVHSINKAIVKVA